ncbi:restriction endonuclease subunit S [Elizabethkingia anophelis]|uniref:restriction endonuclease subunit S n=1 Tax=Elizabethkingia anophelis TaxID=1117645 RepID=UPI00136B4FDB|nr:restriction endonuclease subunit S [Elizabethkingia anophelis]
MRKLGEIAEIKTGNKDTQNKVENGIYPFFVRSNTVERINTYSYDGEAILTSGDGVGVGKNFHYINGRFDFHQRVYSIRNFKDGYDGKYIYSVFSEKFYDRVIRLSAKNSVDSVRMNMISEMKVSFPMFNEQLKIASFLTMIGDRIETQKKIIEDLQITKKEISLKLFKDGFNPSESKKENFQKLGDITYVVNKKNKGNLKLPIYSINNKKGFISQSEQFEGIDSDERGYDISLYKIIEKETFAYNPARINVGSIGYSRNLENIIISSLYVCFKTTDAVDDEFLFHYLRTDIFRKEVLRSVEGGVRDYLFYENFSRIKINLPDLEEQIKIAHFLSKFDEKINLESDLLAQYEHQKKYLLQNLFV